jgi:CubicO group peptidase (beta-lactamase class C family)
MTALALAHLVGTGKVAYEDKVSKYWPEFCCHGKEDWYEIFTYTTFV